MAKGWQGKDRMNLREGTRRLALLLGLVGVIFGGFGSYLQLQSTMRQKADHLRFEQLANSPVVQQERNQQQVSDWQTVSDPGAWQDVSTAQAAPAPALRPAGKEETASNAKVYLDDNGNPIPKFNPNAPYSLTDNAPTKSELNVVTPLPSEVNKGGIKIIRWAQGTGYGVSSIETEDGETLYPTPAPGAWSYAGIAILPFLGFFIPWGAVRMIGWVVTGFVTGPK